MKSGLKRITVALCTLVAGALVPVVCDACPTVGGFPDYNCDGKFSISFFGDSITRGSVDPLINSKTGGVPLRVQKYLKQHLPKGSFKVWNFGHIGITCKGLRVEMRNRIKHNEDGVAASDATIINCGMNDFFTHQNPVKSAAYLQAMKRIAEDHGIFGTVTMVTQTRVPAMQVWVAALNSEIFSFASQIRYDLITPKTMVPAKGFHPNGDGYNFMAEQCLNYLTDPSFISLGEEALELSDVDGDELYDSFEISKFDTDPADSDTDDDGLGDGVEIFTYSTDPLLPDTDADGTSDADEITLGRDPLDPND